MERNFASEKAFRVWVGEHPNEPDEICVTENMKIIPAELANVAAFTENYFHPVQVHDRRVSFMTACAIFMSLTEPHADQPDDEETRSRV